MPGLEWNRVKLSDMISAFSVSNMITMINKITISQIWNGFDLPERKNTCPEPFLVLSLSQIFWLFTKFCCELVYFLWLPILNSSWIIENSILAVPLQLGGMWCPYSLIIQRITRGQFKMFTVHFFGFSARCQNKNKFYFRFDSSLKQTAG